MTSAKDKFRESIERAKRSAKEIQPKPCPIHGKALVATCGQCARYCGEWFAHGYLTLNIEMHEKMADGLDALRELVENPQNSRRVTRRKRKR